MNAAMTGNLVAVCVNVVLLTALMIVYARMLRQVRTSLTVGLLLFAFVLWVQSAAQLYFFATMMAYYAPGIDGLILVQNLLGTIASLFLLAVTWFPAGLRRSRPSAAQ